MRRSIRTMSCLALLLTLTIGCSSAGKSLMPQLEAVERPPPPAVLMVGCPAPPPVPPRSSFPANDARPLVAIVTEQISAGDQCRTVVDGWKAWDVCMRMRVTNPEAACPVLQSVINQLKPPDMLYFSIEPAPPPA